MEPTSNRRLRRVRRNSRLREPIGSVTDAEKVSEEIDGEVVTQIRFSNWAQGDVVPHPASQVPLLHLRSTRILLLHPAASREERITCDLIAITMGAESKETYAALSYTWGPPFEGQTLDNGVISVGEREWSVTGNLHNALRCLRSLDVTKRFWIDALCIDQDNLQERGTQVAMMGDIYAHAQKTIAWLGEDCCAGDVEELFAICRMDIRLQQRVRTPGLRTPIREYIETMRTTNERPPVSGEDCWSAPGQLLFHRTLECLLRRRYFSRRWIIQELTRAPKVALQCGNLRVPWIAFRDLLGDARSSHLRKSHTFLRCKESPTPSILYNDITPQFLENRVPRYDWRGPHAAEFLLKMLVGSIQFQCSHMHDMVYALLGTHAEFSTLDLRVDYSTSTAQCYMDLARCMVDHGIWFPLLCLAALQGNSRHRGLPSWVVDWSIQQPIDHSQRTFYDDTWFLGWAFSQKAELKSNDRLRLHFVHYRKDCKQVWPHEASKVSWRVFPYLQLRPVADRPSHFVLIGVSERSTSEFKVSNESVFQDILLV